jgi:predicted RND superfamily exporter protein
MWDLVSKTTVSGRFVDMTDSVITMRVAGRVHTASSAQLRSLLKRVNELVQSHLADYRSTVTGLAPYFARVEQYVISTQIESFAAAFAAVIILMAIISASLRTGSVVIVANILPVAVVLGLMGWLNIPLDISTVMIAAIAIGIVVDDTIHLLYSFRRERQKGTYVEVSLRKAFGEVGLPVLTTSVVLAMGFAAMLPARFVPTAYFGGLLALTVLVAALADLILLPAMILVVHRLAGGEESDRYPPTI